MDAPAPEQFGSRYARQVILPGVGAHGQQRLQRSHAIIAGVGALGCVVADLLARAGVGRLTLIDRDIVEPANLQRQTLYAESEVGLPKVEAAAARLARVNSSIAIEPLALDLSPRTAKRALLEHAQRADVLVDGSDNFRVRYLLNDASVSLGVPLVYGGAIATRGTQATFDPASRRACLRCLSEPPAPGVLETCETSGVLAPVVWIVAGAQAMDALKVLLGHVDRLSGTVLEFDAWANTRRRVSLADARDPACPCCVQRRFEFLHEEAGGAQEEIALCGQNAVQVTPAGNTRLDLATLAQRLESAGGVQRGRFFVRFTPRDGAAGLSLSIFADGRAIVQGVTSAPQARAAYARWVGL